MAESMDIPRYDDLSLVPTDNNEWKLYIESVLEDDMSIRSQNEKCQKYLDIDTDDENRKYQAATSA